MNEFVMDNTGDVIIPCDSIHLEGMLHIPNDAIGMVIFAHGSGSSRFSSRNQYIAHHLQQARLGTLLFDLLTAQEDQIDEVTKEYRFNIELLAERLLAVSNWILTHPIAQALPLGYFGASTGGGAALLAAANGNKLIKAIVSRGGRPDLAGIALQKVQAATLLLVGEQDEQVIKLNEQAYAQLHCPKKIIIIPGATHLFEEPGKLKEVAQFANAWFTEYLV